MATPNENRQFMEQLDARLKKIESNPIQTREKIAFKEFEDIKDYDLLKVRILHAGLPIFNTVPAYTGFQGETVLYDNKTNARAIYTYLNGTWYSVAVT